MNIRQCPAHCNYMSTAYVGDIVKVNLDGTEVKQATIPADRITKKNKYKYSLRGIVGVSDLPSACVDDDVSAHYWTAYEQGFTQFEESIFTVAKPDSTWLETATLIGDFSYLEDDGSQTTFKLFKTKLEYEYNNIKLSCYIMVFSSYTEVFIGNPYLIRHSFGTSENPVTLDFPDNLEPITIRISETRSGLAVTFYIKNDTEPDRKTLDLNLTLLNLVDEISVVNLDNLYFSVNGVQLQLAELEEGMYALVTEEVASNLRG